MHLRYQVWAVEPRIDETGAFSSLSPGPQLAEYRSRHAAHQFAATEAYNWWGIAIWDGRTERWDPNPDTGVIFYLPTTVENPARFPRATEIQTLIFDRDTFTRSGAKRWAAQHGWLYGDKHIHETGESIRIRQRDPGDFVKTTFRTIELRPGIKAVIGMPKLGRASV